MNYFLTVLLFFSSQLCVFGEQYNLFEENGRFGLKDKQGVTLIPAQYEALGWSEGSFSVLEQVIGYKQNDLWGLVTVTNQKLTPAEYFALYPGNEGLLIASKRSPLTLRISTGCINTSGKIIIPYKYSGIKLHSMRAIVYTLDGNRLKYGLIDLNNKPILPLLYQNIYPIGSLRYAVQNFKNKTALFSENGKTLIDFVIDSIAPVNNGFSIIYRDGKQGLMDREGELIRQPQYREIKFEDNKYRLRLSDEWHLLEASNKLIHKIDADSVVPIGANRMKIISAAGAQLTDAGFRPVGAEKPDKIVAVRHGVVTFRKNNKTGVMNTNGTVIFPATFDHIQIDNGYVQVYSSQTGNPSCTLYDTLGRKITDKTYDRIERYNGSFFPVVKNGFYGGIDTKGAEIIACAYDSLVDVLDDLAVVKFKQQYGVINLKEQWIVLPQSNKISLLHKDRYFEHAGGLTFLKSMDGTIIYFTSNKLHAQGDHLIELTSSGGKWTINFNGQIVHREQPSAISTERIFPSSEGLRGILRNGKYGFIDDLGRLRIANRYEDIMPFSEGLAAIKVRGKWGFLNKEDKIAIQPVFEEVYSFENGKSKVMQNGKYGLIDRTGKILLEFRFDDLRFEANNRIITVSGQHIGLADEQGNVILQTKYESLEDMDNGFVIVRQNGKYGVVNLQGISTIPTLYDQLLFEPSQNRFLGLKRSAFEELKL